MTADIISLVVVVVFVLIVYRKRLAPLFRGNKQQEKNEAVAEMPADTSGQIRKEEGCIYIHVYSIDTFKYASMSALSEAIETNLYDRLGRIYNDYAGRFVGVDCIRVDQGILLFLISWHT